MRNFLNRVLLVGTLAGLGAISTAPAAFASTTLEAYGLRATGPISIVKQPDATLADTNPAPVATAAVAGITATTLSASVTQGSSSESANARAASVSSTDALGISATGLQSTCAASDGDGTAGGIAFTSLTVGGTAVTGDVAPNTVIQIPGVATVTLNEQIPASPGTGDLVVNAVHISLTGSAQDIIIASAQCGPAPSATGAPIASGTGLGLGLGLGLLAAGGLGLGVMRVRRRQAQLI